MTTNKERPLAVLGSTVLATLAAVLVLALAFAPAASAATIDYGTFFGTDVEFSDVSETSSDPLPLFGPPTVSGNSLDFNPLAFSATSDGGGSEATSADLSFTVAAKSGSVIKGISLSEIGTATLAGNVPPGSMGTAAVVVTSGFLHIHEVDFVGIGDIAVPFALTFSPSGGTYFLGTDGGGGPFFSSQWTGSATLNVDAILAANGVAFEHGVRGIGDRHIGRDKQERRKRHHHPGRRTLPHGARARHADAHRRGLDCVDAPQAARSTAPPIPPVAF
jgi:hypothetical protein